MKTISRHSRFSASANILFVFLLLSSLTTMSSVQQSKVVDLEKLEQASKSGSDSVKSSALEQLVSHYHSANKDSSKMYLDQYEQMALQSGSDLYKASFYRLKGLLFAKQRQSDSAIYFYDKAVTHSLKVDDLNGLLKSYNNLVIILNQQNKADSALWYNEQAIKVFEEFNYSEGLAEMYSKMGSLYSNIDLEKSVEYKFKALDLSTELGDLTNQGELHINIGNSLVKLNRAEEAIEEINLGIEIFKELENDKWLSNGYRVLSNLYEGDERIKYTELSLEYAQNSGDDYTVFGCRDKLINTYQMYDRWKDALDLLHDHRSDLTRLRFSPLEEEFERLNVYLEMTLSYKKLGNPIFKTYLDSAEAISLPMDQLGIVRYRNLLVMSQDVYKHLGMFEKAYYYLDKRDSLEKSFLTEQSDLALSKLKVQYETEQKEQEIASLEQQAEIQDLRSKVYLFGGVMILLLLSGGGYFYYRQYKAKRDQASLELEQRFLRSQLNPHFIFNSIGAIQQYLLTESPEKASDYMSLFSKLMRQILENSRQEFITLEEEVNMLTNYLEVQKLRFQNAFDYSIELDEDLDPEYDGIPPMFAQPFIENALEHGLFKKDNNEIRIKFTKVSDDLISLEITDNGTGMIEKLIKTSDHQSLATTITNERLDKMRVTYKTDFSMRSENITNQSGEVEGYKVTLSLPSKFVA
ncbi:tetratricopeptide repeat-containing sensor histidine kinase [Marinoscillum pacificum]|uniref:tetratricopeptide repeat-containing sensor histidine kinase n=1 Tax=Marinoscillum pacificum TaxID=392723 RepID=UPI00215787DD|nr:histidine kinase [Marinoscillum pacificum]